MRPFGLVAQPVPMVGGSDVLARAPGRLETVVDGQLLAFDPRSGNTHVLNASAALVLMSLDGRSTVDEIVDRLEAETGADRAVLDRDVVETLVTLLRGGLATWFVADSDRSGPTDLAEPLDRWRPVIEQRLDRVEWPIVIGPIRAGGAAVTVRVDDPAVAAGLDDALASLPTLAEPPHGPMAMLSIDSRSVGRPGDEVVRHRVHADGSRIGWATDTATAVRYALAGINLLASWHSPDRLVIHAGAVERDGRVVVIAGPSGRGKTTLTGALVQRGFGYLTDELVIVDPRTRHVEPYPKALDLDRDARVRLGLGPGESGPDDEEHVPPTALGRVSDGGVVALVVLLAEPDVGGEPVVLPPDRAMVRLLADVVPETWEVAGALDAVADLCERSPVVVLPRLGLDEAVDVVSGLLTTD